MRNKDYSIRGLVYDENSMLIRALRRKWNDMNVSKFVSMPAGSSPRLVPEGLIRAPKSGSVGCG
jgi:hypothetical protein